MKIGQYTRQLMMDDYKGKMEDSEYVFFTNFKGISADGMRDVRSQLRKHSAGVVVVNNSLFKRTLRDLKMDMFLEYVDGEVAVIYGKDEPIAITKLIQDLKKKNESFSVKAGYLEDRLLNSEEVKELASIPSREILYGQVVNLMKSPLNGLVFALKSNIQSLINVIKGIKEKKES
ncbi:MAG: 50S ribosomal protein L10 [Candidatus Kaelpia aquatica]|nr:50S ribosomal protein L10 [Candidatus Kaelpia aquatica]